jgi:hypothetical protein
MILDGKDFAKGLIVTSLAPAPAGGFWVQYDNPELFEDDPLDAYTTPLWGAPDLGSVSWRGSITAIPGKNGYYIVTPQGRVYAKGDTKIDSRRELLLNYRVTGRVSRNSNKVPAGASTDLPWPISPVAAPIAAPAAGPPKAKPTSVPAAALRAVFRPLRGPDSS